MLTATHVPGGPAWLDLGTPDIEAAAAFYGSVLGWTYVSAGPEAGGYGFLQTDGRTVAAIGSLTDEGATSAWTAYFRTTDAEATVQAVRQAGGTVRFPPEDVFTAGRMAGFTDPTGAEFAVWQPGDVQGLDVVNIANSLSWLELYTTDSAAAKDFYAAVFSWQATESPMNPGYSIVGPDGGGAQAMHGAILQLQDVNLAAGSTSEWHPYFEVTDCDAAVAAAAAGGATVIISAMDVPLAGRLAMFLDPFGAQFAVITSAVA